MSTRNSAPTVWSTAKDIWVNGPRVGRKRHISTPEERLRDVRSSIVVFVAIALAAIECVLRMRGYSLWGVSFALNALFVVWLFWPLVRKLAIAVGAPRV